MPTPTLQEIDSWRGLNVRDPEGSKVGSVGEIYVDERTGEPEWLSVNTGLFGMRESIVPAEGAVRQDDEIVISHSKSEVKDAPSVDADDELSVEEERALYDYYGRAYEPAEPTGNGRSAGEHADDAMTRSEEELRVGTRRNERGRVRLRKHVTTEERDVRVPVQREEVRLEREPITDANVEQATAGPDLTESEHEEVIYEEEPVVEKRTVPRERVRLAKDARVDEEHVSDEVRKEHIDVEDEDARRR